MTKKSKIRLFIIAAALAAASGILFAVFVHIGGILDSQKAAARFRGKNELQFAQTTAFFPVGEGTSLEGIFNFHKALDEALTGASVEAPKNGSLYIEAYSGYGQITVTSPKASVTVRTIGVGGDFFEFHPLTLRSGSYIAGSDLMHDRVMLDEELAWRLFGGVDLAGLEVTINDRPYIIAGVVSREDDFASKRAYTDGPSMFMAYDALESLTDTEISSYELVCAEPVSGFVLSTLKENFSTATAIENSGRFSVGSVMGIIGSYGTRSARTSAVIYPYWENAARMVEDILAVILLFALIFAAPPVLLAAVLAYLMLRRGWREFKAWVPKRIERAKESRYERRKALGGR